MNIEIASCKEVANLLQPFTTELLIEDFFKCLESKYTLQIHKAVENHIVSLHHVAKIENKYHKIPATRQIKNLLEPEGKMLHTIFELCVGLHPRASNPYKNAYYWFFDINKEIIKGKILQILNPFEINKKPKNGDKKRHITNVYNKQISDIKDFQNPYIKISHLPLMSNLIDLAIAKSEISHEFKQKYLNPHVSASRNLANSYLSPAWCTVTSQDGKNSYQGKGGHKIFF